MPIKVIIGIEKIQVSIQHKLAEIDLHWETLLLLAAVMVGGPSGEVLGLLIVIIVGYGERVVVANAWKKMARVNVAVG